MGWRINDCHTNDRLTTIPIFGYYSLQFGRNPIFNMTEGQQWIHTRFVDWVIKNVGSSETTQVTNMTKVFVVTLYKSYTCIEMVWRIIFGKHVFREIIKDLPDILLSQETSETILRRSWGCKHFKYQVNCTYNVKIDKLTENLYSKYDPRASVGVSTSAFVRYHINKPWHLLRRVGIDVFRIWTKRPKSYNIRWQYCHMSNCLLPTDSTFPASSQLTTTIHWPCYCNVHVYVVIYFAIVCGTFWVETNLCRFVL